VNDFMLAAHLLADFSKLPLSLVLDGRLTEEEWYELGNMATFFVENPNHFNSMIFELNIPTADKKKCMTYDYDKRIKFFKQFFDVMAIEPQEAG